MGNQVVIQWRAGHTQFTMTQSYIDRGRVEARRIGTPFPPLPPGLFPIEGMATAAE